MGREVKQQGQFQSAAVRSVKLEAEREHRHKSWATKTEELALVTHVFPKVPRTFQNAHPTWGGHIQTPVLNARAFHIQTMTR